MHIVCVFACLGGFFFIWPFFYLFAPVFLFLFHAGSSISGFRKAANSSADIQTAGQQTKRDRNEHKVKRARPAGTESWSTRSCAPPTRLAGSPLPPPPSPVTRQFWCEESEVKRFTRARSLAPMCMFVCPVAHDTGRPNHQTTNAPPGPVPSLPPVSFLHSVSTLQKKIELEVLRDGAYACSPVPDHRGGNRPQRGRRPHNLNGTERSGGKRSRGARAEE